MENRLTIDVGESSPKKRQRTQQVQLFDVKLEPDETCVLPTDNIVKPSVRKRKPAVINTKVTLRALINAELLTLDLLQQATPGMLRELFGELQADELSRQFTYCCRFLPKSCSCYFKSFGNENKAGINIERHLAQHVDDLAEQLDKEGHGSKMKFTVESLQARARRFEKPKPKKAVKDKKAERQVSVVLERLQEDIPSQVVKMGGRSCKRFTKRKELSPPEQEGTNVLDAGEARESDTEVDVEKVVDKMEITFDVAPKPPAGDSGVLMETESLLMKNSEMIAKVQNQLRLKKQPYKDHPYSILEKGPVRQTFRNALLKVDNEVKPVPFVYSISNKSEWDNEDSDTEDEDVVHHDLACHYAVMGARLKTGFMWASSGGRVPIVQLLQVPQPQQTAPTVGEEVMIIKCKPKVLNPVSTRTGCIVESESEDEETVVTTLARPYPPMPKYQPELGTKLVIPEEEISFPQNDDDLPDKWDFENADHVKRFAIRCMRELKLTRGLGIRNCTVSCKICDKDFTATATLMYHYRSHANIKPFICLLCNATFTRQHSLNYHMLIHNDATRFKCPDCGRAFRHPSHYKEHRRRHTGEQPYHCPQCGMKFKTRNSFKRHVTSRHPDHDIKIVMTKEAREIPEERISVPHKKKHVMKNYESQPKIVSSSSLPVQADNETAESPTEKPASSTTYNLTDKPVGAMEKVKLATPPAEKVQQKAPGQSLAQPLTSNAAENANMVAVLHSKTALGTTFPVTAGSLGKPPSTGKPVIIKMTDVNQAGSKQFTTVKIMNHSKSKPGFIVGQSSTLNSQVVSGVAKPVNMIAVPIKFIKLPRNNSNVTSSASNLVIGVTKTLNSGPVAVSSGPATVSSVTVNSRSATVNSRSAAVNSRSAAVSSRSATLSSRLAAFSSQSAMVSSSSRIVSSGPVTHTMESCITVGSISKTYGSGSKATSSGPNASPKTLIHSTNGPKIIKEPKANTGVNAANTELNVVDKLNAAHGACISSVDISKTSDILPQPEADTEMFSYYGDEPLLCLDDQMII